MSAVLLGGLKKCWLDYKYQSYDGTVAASLNQRNSDKRKNTS